MDAYEKVLELTQDYEHRIHHQIEDGENKDDYFSLEIINKTGTDNLFIHFNPFEITLFFADNHDHFDPNYDDEIYWLIDLIEDILNNKRCASSISCLKENGPQLLSTCFCSRKEADENDIDKTFDLLFKMPQAKEALEKNGGIVNYRFWDSSLNKEISIAKKQGQ